ncbi:MAG: hypothetical protein ABJC12_13345 [Saprospiraceae bacterium]
MNRDPNFQFICEKISLLRTAVMYSMSNSLVRMPNDIVKLVKVDEDGQLWFLAHFPVYSLQQCEKIFPVRLHFFRKGFDFFVEISGKATIESNIGDSSSKDNANASRSVLVKMTMNNVEYREPHARKDKTKFQVIVERSYKWMLRNVGFDHTESSVFGKIH